MFKIALNAGHGLYTKGKRCDVNLDPNETREWALNSRICDKIEERLKSYTGYELIRLDDRTGKTDYALKTRTDKANAFKADFYLSIHHNAGIKGGSGGGVVAYVYTNVDAETKDWQEKLYNAIVKYAGLKGNRANPLAQSNLHECRETNMPAVLIECGFMDSSTDVPIILTDDFADKVAYACVEILAAKGNLALNKNESATSNTQDGSETIYVVKKGDTLSEIASMFNTTYQTLAAYNSISNPSKIYVGQEIKIPTATVTAAPSEPKVNYFKKYTGNSTSIIDALKAVGAESSFNYRSKIAKANGIKLYAGSGAQNSKMLELLKQGMLIKP